MNEQTQKEIAINRIGKEITGSLLELVGGLKLLYLQNSQYAENARANIIAVLTKMNLSLDDQK